jgi:formylglycine-generating enzyme required for sulfatase activity
MVELPVGEFMMGSPEDERGRERVEGAPRRVMIAKPFAIGRFEVTVDQFSAFVAETGTAVSSRCRLIVKFEPIEWGPPEASFREPGYGVTDSHPVGCVSWHEAQGVCGLAETKDRQALSAAN